MDEEKRPLSEEEAIAFAGVTESTLHRYISAGFINPVVEGDQRFFDEDELIQVFELSPKKAAASRKALKKKALSPAEKLISEKDRLVADKDIQIRDLKDQRSWLQSRVERLEAELLTLKSKPGPAATPVVSTATGITQTIEFSATDATSVAEPSEAEPAVEESMTDSREVPDSPVADPISATPLASVTVISSPVFELDSTKRYTTRESEGSLKKVLRYLGFIKPEPAPQPPAITSRASEIIALDRTGERVATVPRSDESVPDKVIAPTGVDKPLESEPSISDNIIEVSFTGSTASPEAPASSQTAVNQSVMSPAATTQPIRGNRPFRESKQTLAELLGDNRPLDPSFAANDESE
jgi:hypothetical protein